MSPLLDLNQALTAGNVLALPLSLAGGFIAGMNPCCVALYPAAVGVCCDRRKGATSLSLPSAFAFVFGIALAIAGLGVFAAYIGRVAVVAAPLRYAIAAVPILMGLDRLGWLRLPLAMPRVLYQGAGGAFGAGLLLALVIGPCGTPVLASVLAFAAYKQSFLYGGLLLLLYGLGNGLPLVLVGTAGGGLLRRLDAWGFGNRTDAIVGGLLLLLGFYLLWMA